MFRQKTLFVLGAGSSHEVHLPVGNTLKNHIAEKLNFRYDYSSRSQGDAKIMTALRQHAARKNLGYENVNPYIQRSLQLVGALPYAISIDNLLEAYQKDEISLVCGKLGIVRSILEAEQNSSLYFRDTHNETLKPDKVVGTWFIGFIKILTENVGVDDLETIFDNVSFLVFNYDRCLLRFLHAALQTYYSIDARRAETILSKVKILHPYGRVGKLPWESGDTVAVPFGSESVNLLPISEQIKTFTETSDDIRDIADIHGMVQNATTIVFLGFAFHKQNLEIMRTGLQNRTKHIYGTAFGISSSDIQVIYHQLQDILQPDDKKIKIEIQSNLKCADLINEYWRSLTQ